MSFRTLLLLFTLHPLLFANPAFSQVLVGADQIFSDEYFCLIAGKRVGLVTNHTAVLRNGVHLADSLARHPQVKLVALFGPEHGIRGEAGAGDEVRDSVDSVTGVRVFSLYGRTYKPTKEMLEGIDVLLYDIQDVGVRFYTYISTMTYAMEAAAEADIPFIVLDRPNPITGGRVEGFVLEDSLKSFVGMHPIPIVHGMTTGELASMINGQGWLKGGIKARLTVVRMHGWTRSMWYNETDLPWIPPSPNMRTLRTAVVYPGTCLFEGTNFSEGRGTDSPFELIGAPFVDAEQWASDLNGLKLPGVRFRPAVFTPVSSKHAGAECRGVRVEVTDRAIFRPVRTALWMLATVFDRHKNDAVWRPRAIDRLAGTPFVRQWIDEGQKPDAMLEHGNASLREFLTVREFFLLY